MEPARLLAQVTFALVGLAFLVYVAVQTIRYASKGSSGAQVLGAAFMLIGFGNMRDPTNEIVQQAKQLKRQEEDDAGDPPEEVDH